jgi:hypothetical protein
VVDDERAQDGLDDIYEILSRRFRSGQKDLAARHNEHQPTDGVFPRIKGGIP